MAESTIKKRPKNLDLASIRLPLAGKVSILHRVSGAGMFLCFPLMLWLFSASVTSVDSFCEFAGKSRHGRVALGIHSSLLCGHSFSVARYAHWY